MKSLPIDGCLVINLPCRTDRWEVFQKQSSLLESLGLQPARMDAVSGAELPGYGEKPWFRQRHSAKRDQAWAGKAGCTLSHRNAIALAKARGWKTVLILEDDISFDEKAVTAQWGQLLDIIGLLKDDWVAVYLYGHYPRSPFRLFEQKPATTCYEVHGLSSTAAYILNGRYFDTLLGLLPGRETIWEWTARNKAVDRWYARQLPLLGPVYACAPFDIITIESVSDATTEGKARVTASFEIKRITNRYLFPVAHVIRLLKNRIALKLACFRCWLKNKRGL